MFSVRVIPSASLRSTRITGGKWSLKRKRSMITWTLNSRLSQSSITLTWPRGWSSPCGTMIRPRSTSWSDWRNAPSMICSKLNLADNHGQQNSRIPTSPMTKSVAQSSSISQEFNEITWHKNSKRISAFCAETYFIHEYKQISQMQTSKKTLTKKIKFLFIYLSHIFINSL